MRRLLSLAMVTVGCQAVDKTAAPLPDLHEIDATTWTEPEEPPAVPIMGGTLLSLSSGDVAFADPNRHTVFWGPPDAPTDTRVLLEDATPWRLTEGDDQVFVTLRAAKAVQAVHLADGSRWRATPCAEPRGTAWDPADRTLVVACASGELVRLAPDTGAVLHSTFVDYDLRDVVIQDDRIFLSRLRTAEVLEVTRDGTVLARRTPPPFVVADGRDGDDRTFTASVGYRLRAHPEGGVALLHQRGTIDPIDVTATPAFGTHASTDGIIHAALTWFDGGVATSPALDVDALAVDFAFTDDAILVATAGAGAGAPLTAFDRDDVFASAEAELLAADTPIPPAGATGIVQSVAVDGAGRWMALETLGTALHREGEAPIHDESPVVRPEGHELFNRTADIGMACASCHPEGQDDGRVWTFAMDGHPEPVLRRTMSMRIGIQHTGPYHWNGELPTMGALMDEVLGHRMGEPSFLMPWWTVATWLDDLPPIRYPPDDAAAVARGEALFASAEVGCAGCHDGPWFTNATTVDVGTGERFQVPGLIGIGTHPPYLHDGCARTLRERFDPACGGTDHGATSHLGEAELDDLIAYLMSL